MASAEPVASIIMAAGRGTRMRNYQGNKTLLPLIPVSSPFEGSQPLIQNILENLPQGPRCIVVHHHKEAVIKATEKYEPYYCQQKILDGTGGALLACKSFLERVRCKMIIITMGDVPLVRKVTYNKLIDKLESYHMVVLGFAPQDKRQYGLLDVNGQMVRRIIEWKYWKDLSESELRRFSICNSGIYAARRADLLAHLGHLSSCPHEVQKQINGVTGKFDEYFLTDLVEIFREHGKTVGFQTVENPDEVMGVDDLQALTKAQRLYKEMRNGIDRLL